MCGKLQCADIPTPVSNFDSLLIYCTLSTLVKNKKPFSFKFIQK